MGGEASPPRRRSARLNASAATPAAPGGKPSDEGQKSRAKPRSKKAHQDAQSLDHADEGPSPPKRARTATKKPITQRNKRVRTPSKETPDTRASLEPFGNSDSEVEVEPKLLVDVVPPAKDTTTGGRPRRSVAAKPAKYTFKDAGSSSSDISSPESSEDESSDNIKVNKKGRKAKATRSSSSDSDNNFSDNEDEDMSVSGKRGRRAVQSVRNRNKDRSFKEVIKNLSQTMATSKGKATVVRYRQGADVELQARTPTPVTTGSCSRPMTPSSSSAAPSPVEGSNGGLKAMGSKTISNGERTMSEQERRWQVYLDVAAALARGRTEEVTIEEAAELLIQLKQQIRGGGKVASVAQNAANNVKPRGDGSSSSEDEWEDMEAVDEAEAGPQKKLEVTIGKKKVEADWAVKWLRQEMNKCIRTQFENGHKIHVLCWIGHLQIVVKRVLDEGIVVSLALTQMPSGFASASGNPISIAVASKFAKWIYSAFKISSERIISSTEELGCRYEETALIAKCIQDKTFSSDFERALVFFVCFRAMEVPTRLVANCRIVGKKREDYDFERNVKPSKAQKKGSKAINNGTGSVEERCDYWVEWWCDSERRWIYVDPQSGVIDTACEKENTMSMPAYYVFACDNDGGVRDVGARYLSSYATPLYRRMRTDQSWLNKVFQTKRVRANPSRARLEDLSFMNDLAARPLPTSISDYKNHPLYVLEKDLLKFQAIYPPSSEQKPIGEVRGHKVFPRSTVYTLQGDLNWIKLARSVKEGEKPYKVVKARPNMRLPAEERGEPKDLPVYGFWQTEPYRVPQVIDGRIPRNEYGNLYVYQDAMVPDGCVHLKLPGIVNLCRRLNKEHVPAVVGWDFHGCSNHPILEGAVVLTRDVEELIREWEAAEARRAAREKKKRDERVSENWRKLIKGALRLHQMKQQFTVQAKKNTGELEDGPVDNEVRDEERAAWPPASYGLPTMSRES